MLTTHNLSHTHAHTHMHAPLHTCRHTHTHTSNTPHTHLHIHTQRHTFSCMYWYCVLATGTVNTLFYPWPSNAMSILQRYIPLNLLCHQNCSTQSECELRAWMGARLFTKTLIKFDSMQHVVLTVSMSAFLACHQCNCAGSSLVWGLNLRTVVCGISEARRQGFSQGTPVSSPPTSVTDSASKIKFK